MKLEQMPRYPLLCGFTPLQRMENLEQALGCGPLYIKRDDLTLSLIHISEPTRPY